MRNSLRIGRLFGIELRVDTSWIFIAALVVWSLSSTFASWHPDWGPAIVYATAFAAALTFFASVLFHELAHSLVARFVYKLPVRDITLHMFGGVSSIEREPPTPAAELFIAIVGPISSVVLGVAMLLAGAVVTGLFSVRDGVDPTRALATMGPLATLLVWLGPVNVMVGLFNMIPGFPLDGGRILRSVLWLATGSLAKATRWATTIGQIVGWAFVAAGIAMAFGVAIPFFGRGLASGLWLVLIGFFLRNAAAAHQQGAAIAEALAGVRVGDLMQTRGGWTAPTVPLSALAQEWFAPHHDDAFPVFDDARFVGIVSRNDLKKVAPSAWATTRVADVMTPRDRIVSVAPEDEAMVALQKLGSSPHRQLPVLSGDELVGMVHEKDIGRWLELLSSRAIVVGRPRHA